MSARVPQVLGCVMSSTDGIRKGRYGVIVIWPDYDDSAILYRSCGKKLSNRF